MPLFRRNTCNRGSPQFRRLTKLAVFLSAFSIAASAHAATYYIAPNGNDGGAGTSAAPWKTFAFALPKLHAGDTLLLQNGTYEQQLTDIPSGTSPSQIVTIKALNTHQAIITCPGSGLLLHFKSGEAYITIDGLVLDGGTNCGGVSFFPPGGNDPTGSNDTGKPWHDITLINNEIRNIHVGNGGGGAINGGNYKTMHASNINIITYETGAAA